MEDKEDTVAPAEIVEQPKQRATRVRQFEKDGQTVWEYSDGSIRNSSGHMVERLSTGGAVITPDVARDFLSRRRLVGLRAQLRGLARANDIDPSEIDDELLMQAGSAVEALTQHMARTFMGSKSLRGMSEAYGALTAPLVGDKREQSQPVETGDFVRSLIADIADIARATVQTRD